MNPLVGFFAVLFAVGIGFAIGTYYVAVNAFVAQRLWAWFAVPRGLPPLDWESFLAVFLFIALVRGIRKADSKKLTAEDYGTVFASLIAPWFILLTGWLFQ